MTTSQNTPQCTDKQPNFLTKIEFQTLQIDYQKIKSENKTLKAENEILRENQAQFPAEQYLVHQKTSSTSKDAKMTLSPPSSIEELVVSCASEPLASNTLLKQLVLEFEKSKVEAEKFEKLYDQSETKVKRLKMVLGCIQTNVNIGLLDGSGSNFDIGEMDTVENGSTDMLNEKINVFEHGVENNAMILEKIEEFEVENADEDGVGTNERKNSRENAGVNINANLGAE